MAGPRAESIHPSEMRLTFAPWMLCLLLAVSAGLRAQGTLHVATDHNPPLAFSSGDAKYSGLAIDLLKQAAAEAKVEVVFEELPWPRAMLIYGHKPNSCLIAMGRTKERESLYQWVGPFTQGGIALFALQSNPVKASSVDEVIAQHLVVGVAADDVAKTVIQRYGDLHVEHMNLQALGPHMLERRRFDLWASGAILGRYQARSQGVAVREVLRLERVDVSLGCALGTDPALIDRLQKALDSLRARGVVARQEHAYLDGLLAPPARK